MTNDITIIRTGAQKSDDKGIELCLKEESIREQAKNARDLFSSIQSELDELDDLKDGLSYLDMKNDTLLSYMIDLCNIFLKKVRGEAISDHPSIERTVYYRVIFEKIKAIDQRLAYQLNKVITMPDNARQDVQGVDINNLDLDLGSDDDQELDESRTRRDTSDDSGDDDDEDEDDEGDEEDDDDDRSVDSSASEKEDNDSEIDSDMEDEPRAKKDTKASRAGTSKQTTSGIYKPPKLRSVAYDDERTEDKTRRRRDYNEFYQDDDDNHDIVEETRVVRDDRRTRYEEENYTRLPEMTARKAKRKAKQAKSKERKKFKSGKRRK